MTRTSRYTHRLLFVSLLVSMCFALGPRAAPAQTCDFSHPELESCADATGAANYLWELVEEYFFDYGHGCQDMYEATEDMVFGGDQIWWLTVVLGSNLTGLHNPGDAGFNGWIDEQELAFTVFHEGVHHAGLDEGDALYYEDLCMFDS